MSATPQSLHPVSSENPLDDRSLSGVRKILLENGLSIVLLVLFLGFLVGQTLTGWLVYNDELRQAGQATVSLVQYLFTGHWLEATAENWESEFLQMGAFVSLTAYLFQKGSPESRDPYKKEPQRPVTKDSPWPARKGGWIKTLYGFSLSIAFLLLFLASFILHAIGGTAEHNRERLVHGESPLTTLQYMATSQFWFESFQNWQSEFLAIAAMVILAIFLRHKNSPESKSVATPHHEHEE